MDFMQEASRGFERLPVVVARGDALRFRVVGRLQAADASARLVSACREMRVDRAALA